MKLGIVGKGKIVKELLTIAPQLKDMGIEEIVLYARGESEAAVKAAEKFAGEYGILNVYYNYSEFLKSDIDAVYVAIPNSLHYEFVKTALLAGKDVIVEKPAVMTCAELSELAKIAEENRVMLVEAMTTCYLPAYQKIKEWLPLLGTVHLVQAMFCQYSSRYDDFKNGKIAPAFDPELGGGALRDINVYNVSAVTGLFGSPEAITYHADVEQNVDVSGVLALSYDRMQAVCIGSKNCDGENGLMIQGENGRIVATGAVNGMSDVRLILRKEEEKQKNQHFTNPDESHRMYYEFRTFIEKFEKRDYAWAKKMLAQSMTVADVVDKAAVQNRSLPDNR